MYTLFVVLHLISVGVIVGLVTTMIIGTVLRKKVKGTPGEIAAIRSGAMMAPIMANIGSIGLLVTGVTMSWMNYSFFQFNSLPWLAMKQTIFVIIMAISGSVLAPTGKKILALSTAELATPGAAMGASSELRAMVSRQYAVVLFVAFLVLCNMILGESKAMMWVHPQ